MDSFWNDLKDGKFASMVKESSKGQALSNSQEVYNVLKPIMAKHDDIEVLYGIFMDSKNRILIIEELSRGSLNASAVYPREVIKKVLEHRAAALIMAHNHPSGDPNPSREDYDITVRVGFALSAIGVALHDHTIIGNTHFSMADSGWMKKAQDRFHELVSGISIQ